MKKLKPRREPKQSRSRQLRDSILTAATYVLKRHGAAGFNTNRVAERAGVNIASLYQYYPDKEALLFHLVELEWKETWARLDPILWAAGTPRNRLHAFLRAFFESEAEEAELRKAMRSAAVAIEDSREHRELQEKARSSMQRFVKEAVPAASAAELRFKTDFVLTLIVSYAESRTGHEPLPPTLLKEADTLAALVSSYLGI